MKQLPFDWLRDLDEIEPPTIQVREELEEALVELMARILIAVVRKETEEESDES